MVGVAGKSQACHDCKRRRVKCDFGKPSCLTCKRAQISCQGYDKTSIFVNRTLAKPSTTALTVISARKQHGSKRICKLPSTLLQRFEQLRSNMSDLSCSPLAFRAQAWEILKKLYLPNAQFSAETNLPTTTPYSWVPVVCEMERESSVLDQALLAFCAIQINIAEPGSTPALRLYSEVLPKLARAIGYAHEREKDETLAAIVVLSTCELFVLPNDDGWRAHAHGISELVRHRTSIDDRSGVWLKLCSRLRIICVIIALRERKTLVLEPSVWRQLLTVDSSVDSLEGLVNIISEVPLLLEDTDQAIASGVASLQLFQALMKVYQKFSSWQQSYRSRSVGPMYWAVPARLHNPSDEAFANKLFPFALEFASLNMAIQCSFSSAVMLQVLTAALLLLGNDNTSYTSIVQQTKGGNTLKLEKSSTGELSWSLLSTQREADRLARFLCQTLEYCFRYEMGTLGAQTTCHPQWALKNYFRQIGLQRELEWCKNITYMHGNSLRSGLTLMLFGPEEK